MVRCFNVHLIYTSLILYQFASFVNGNETAMKEHRYPSVLTLTAGKVPSPTFNDFFDDLLADLQEIALLDNVTISFETEEVGEGYESSLALLDAACVDGETIPVGNTTHNCSAFDFLIGDFWQSPDRYELYDFTPVWLTTSLTALRYTRKEKSPDITSLTEATATGSVICGIDNSYSLRNFPEATIQKCRGENPIETCLSQLETEECSLFVADELVLRRIKSDQPNFEITGQFLQKQYLAWPVRKNLDPAKAFLLNKWIYAALSTQRIDNLYTKHFENKKSCPIGWSGTNCDLPCDPLHGISYERGACICNSVRWTGADCSIQVPEDLNMIPADIKNTAYAMFALNATIIFGCAIWLHRYWWSTQVRFSQPFFLLLVLLGCLISSSTIIAMAQEDNYGKEPVRACIMIPWLYSLGFSITFGTLFAKIRRIYNIFNQQSHTPVAASLRQNSFRNRQDIVATRETLLTVGGVFILDFFVLALWTAVDPLHWERYTIRVDQFGELLESQGYCVSDHWKPFFGAIVSIHITWVALATFMCYKARAIPTQYSEHKYVTVALFSNLQLFILGIPVLVIASADPAAHFFVRSAVVWMNDLVIISLIFGHLMIKQWMSNHELNRDKVQGAVDDIMRRRSGEHSRRMSYNESEKSSGVSQRRNSGGNTPKRPSLGGSDRLGNSDRRSSLATSDRLANSDRRSSLGNSDKYVAAMPILAACASTGQSSIDLDSDEESAGGYRPKDSSVSDISLSGFEPIGSSDDNHNSESLDSSLGSGKGWAAKSRFLPQTHGDMPMMPVRDQTIVEEIEEGEGDYSSSIDETSAVYKDVGSEGIQMHLPPIQETAGMGEGEGRYRASFSCVQPPLIPSRSSSKDEDDTSVTKGSSSFASINSVPMMSPKVISSLQQRASLSPSENAPVKPMRLESEYEHTDHSSEHTSEFRKAAFEASLQPNIRQVPLQPISPPGKPMRLESEYESTDHSGHTSEHRQADFDLSFKSTPHEAPLKPVRFLSEQEEIDSTSDFQIATLQP